MAIMIPSACPSKASAGEMRLFRLFRDILPDDFVVWYEPVVKDRYPDFVILSPGEGLFVLEAKGWYPGNIAKIDDNLVTYESANSREVTFHPIRQVREYMFKLMDELKSHALLRHPNGGYEGRLVFPCGFGVMLSNITREQAQAAGWAHLFPTDKTLYRDDVEHLEGQSPREIISRLRKMFTVPFQFDPLTPDQVKTVRGILHKEVILKSRPATAESVPCTQRLPENAMVLEVLDNHQEETARSIGRGHRIFFGVAGSGKTILLIARAKLLAQERSRRVLFLCFNKPLSAYVASQLTDFPHVAVKTFHGWALPISGTLQKDNERTSTFFERVAQDCLERVQNINAYDAILIDEGQDFAPNWFECCAKALKPDGDLIIAIDGAQSVASRPRRFTWASVGVEAQGRSRRLKENYRNTQEILDLAWHVTQEWRADEDGQEETHVRVRPEKAKRRGPQSVYRTCNNALAEADAVVEIIRSFKADGLKDEEIAVLTPRGGCRFTELWNTIKRNYPVVNVGLSKDSFFRLSGVRLCPFSLVKGLEFGAVIVTMLDELGAPTAETCNQLYVAMTRGTNRLALTWIGDRGNEFTDRIVDRIGTSSPSPGSSEKSLLT